MGQIRIKAGVDLGVNLAPAGARILDCLKAIVRELPYDVTITSARDGEHSGESDPHHTGEAFDLRTHGMTGEQKIGLLLKLRERLYTSSPRRFYAFLESPNNPNEHIHVQRRNGTTYGMLDYLGNL